MGENRMELDKLKHNASLVVFSAAAGAIALAVVGFNVGGWVTGGKASEMVQTAIVEQQIPICVEQFNNDADKATKLAAMKKGQSWMHIEFVTKQGWATMPGAKNAIREVAEGCAEKIAA
jgi:hypothetical protein